MIISIFIAHFNKEYKALLWGLFVVVPLELNHFFFHILQVWFYYQNGQIEGMPCWKNPNSILSESLYSISMVTAWWLLGKAAVYLIGFNVYNLCHFFFFMMQDIKKLKQTVQDLEEQLTEKNKTVKMQQQRLSDLKKTLQRELVRTHKPWRSLCLVKDPLIDHTRPGEDLEKCITIGMLIFKWTYLFYCVIFRYNWSLYSHISMNSQGDIDAMILM